MQRIGRILLRAAFLLAALVLAGVLWRGAVEGWIRQELLALSASQLQPALGIESLRYHFPRSVTLKGVRLTVPDPDAPEDPLHVLAVDTLTLELASIPMPDALFRVERIGLSRPALRLVRSGERFAGLGTLLREAPLASRNPGSPRGQPGDYFQALEVEVVTGRAELDRRDGSPVSQVDGIQATLLFDPTAGGSVAVTLSVKQPPELGELAQERDLAGQLAVMLSRADP